MHRVLSRHAIVPAAWLAVLSLAGCGDRDRSTMARDTAPAGPETGMATDTASADAAGKSAPLTDANIVALLDEANKADSAAGALAVTKATNKAVKDFAKLMMSEHHALREAGPAAREAAQGDPRAAGERSGHAARARARRQALESTPKGAGVRPGLHRAGGRRPQGGARPGGERPRSGAERAAQGADREGEAGDPEASGPGGEDQGQAGPGDQLNPQYRAVGLTGW